MTQPSETLPAEGDVLLLAHRPLRRSRKRISFRSKSGQERDTDAQKQLVTSETSKDSKESEEEVPVRLPSLTELKAKLVEPLIYPDDDFQLIPLESARNTLLMRAWTRVKEATNLGMKPSAAKQLAMPWLESELARLTAVYEKGELVENVPVQQSVSGSIARHGHESVLLPAKRPLVFSDSAPSQLKTGMEPASYEFTNVSLELDATPKKPDPERPRPSPLACPSPVIQPLHFGGKEERPVLECTRSLPVCNEKSPILRFSSRTVIDSACVSPKDRDGLKRYMYMLPRADATDEKTQPVTAVATESHPNYKLRNSATKPMERKDSVSSRRYRPSLISGMKKRALYVSKRLQSLDPKHSPPATSATDAKKSIARIRSASVLHRTRAHFKRRSLDEALSSSSPAHFTQEEDCVFEENIAEDGVTEDGVTEDSGAVEYRFIEHDTHMTETIT